MMTITEIYPDGKEYIFPTGPVVPMRGDPAEARCGHSYESVEVHGNKILCKALPNEDEGFQGLWFACCRFVWSDGASFHVWMPEEEFVEGKKCVVGEMEAFMDVIVKRVPWKMGCQMRPKNILGRTTRGVQIECVV